MFPTKYPMLWHEGTDNTQYINAPNGVLIRNKTYVRQGHPADVTLQFIPGVHVMRIDGDPYFIEMPIKG